MKTVILVILVSIAFAASSNTSYSPTNLLFRHYRESSHLQEVSRYLNFTKAINDTEFCIDMDPCFSSTRPNRCISNMNNWYRRRFQLWDRPRASNIPYFQEPSQIEGKKDLLAISPRHRVHLPYSQQLEIQHRNENSLLSNLWKNQSLILLQSYPNVRPFPTYNVSHLELGAYCYKHLIHVDANVPDCIYDVDLVEYSIEKDQGIQIVLLRIQQSGCSFRNIPAGSMFEVFARNEQETTSCQVRDVVENSYYVTCQLAATSSNTKTNDCIHVTAILQYEHDDAISGTLYEWLNRYRELAYVLLDDQLVCSQDARNPPFKDGNRKPFQEDDQKKKKKYSPEAQIAWRDRLDMSKYQHLPITWYGGRWLNHTATTTSADLCSIPAYFPNHSHILDTKQHTAIYNSTFQTTLDQSPAQGLPFHRLAMLSPHLVADLYRFQPNILLSKSVASSSSSSAQLYTPVDGCERHDYPKLTLLPNTTYLMLGSSHMRYAFDVAVQYFYDEHSLDAFHHYHKVGDIGSLHFNQSHFVPEAVRNLEYHCEQLERQRQEQAGTQQQQPHPQVVLVLQTSAWDLSVTSIRHLLRCPIGYQHLLRTIRNILNGNMPCGQVVRIVWVTAMPYNLCSNFLDSHCTANRGHRNAQSIEAAANIYLQGILDTASEAKKQNSNNHSVELHIVDAFSIIMPRLVYREDREVVCMNHFACTDHNLNVLGPGVFSVLSPAGFAVLRSLFLAMSAEFVTQKFSNNSAHS
jgi:hypothetical protein